jgi:outer membrane murein-binding lipoprotein Lpp
MLSVGKGKNARLIVVVIALVGIGLLLAGCGDSKKMKDLQSQLTTAQGQVTKLTADLKTATDAKTASDKAANDAKAQVTTLQKAYDITPYVATWTTALANGGKVEIVVTKAGDVTLKSLNAAGEAAGTAPGVAGLLPKGEFTVHAGGVFMTFALQGADLKLVAVVGSDLYGAPNAIFKK